MELTYNEYLKRYHHLPDAEDDAMEKEIIREMNFILDNMPKEELQKLIDDPIYFSPRSTFKFKQIMARRFPSELGKEVKK